MRLVATDLLDFELLAAALVAVEEALAFVLLAWVAVVVAASEGTDPAVTRPASTKTPTQKGIFLFTSASRTQGFVKATKGV